jgi:hypothetical protein
VAGAPLGVCSHEVLHTGQAITAAGGSRNATLFLSFPCIPHNILSRHRAYYWTKVPSVLAKGLIVYPTPLKVYYTAIQLYCYTVTRLVPELPPSFSTLTYHRFHYLGLGYGQLHPHAKLRRVGTDHGLVHVVNALPGLRRHVPINSPSDAAQGIPLLYNVLPGG